VGSVRTLLTLCVLWTLALATPAAAEVTISDAARQQFKRGVVLLQEKLYQEAYDSFKAAYAASPSPKILGNLGLTAMKLERDGEAIGAYERYLTEAGAVSEKENRQIIEDLVKLRGRVAQVRLTTYPVQVTVIDERLRDGSPPVVNKYELDDGRLHIGVRTGRHRMTIERDGYVQAVWELEAQGGVVREKTVRLTPVQVAPVSATTPQPDKEAPAEARSEFPSTGFIVAASLTGALGVATIIVGSLALTNKSDFDQALADDDTKAAQDLRDSGVTLNLVTDVLLIGTVVGAGVTAILLAVDLSSDGGDVAGWRVAPSVGLQHAGLVLQGAF
jgi:hypothetical protein